MKLRKGDRNFKTELAKIYVKECKTLYLDTASVMVEEVFDKAAKKDRKAIMELGRLIRIYEKEKEEI